MLTVALFAGCTPNNTTGTTSTITTVDENVYYLDGESDVSGNLSSTDTSAVNSTGEGSRRIPAAPGTAKARPLHQAVVHLPMQPVLPAEDRQLILTQNRRRNFA